MGDYECYEYYILESKTKGDYQRQLRDGIVGQVPLETVKFDTYEEAYREMINLYNAEIYNREEHVYWYIRKYSVVRWYGNGEWHENVAVTYAH